MRIILLMRAFRISSFTLLVHTYDDVRELLGKEDESRKMRCLLEYLCVYTMKALRIDYPALSAICAILLHMF